MKCIEIYKDIYLVTGKSHKEICNAFMRIQEHYENPAFVDKKDITKEDVLEWNKRVHNKSYYQSWGGFNIPIKFLKKLEQDRFIPHSKEERQLLKFFGGIQKGYVIGVVASADMSILVHEVSHALYSLDIKYKRGALKILHKYNTKRLYNMMLKMKYDYGVLFDEMVAYLVDGSRHISKRKDLKNALKDNYISALMRRSIK